LGASLVFCSLLLPAGTTSQEFSTGGDFDQESQAVSLYAAFHFPFHFSKMRSLSLLPPLHAPSLSSWSLDKQGRLKKPYLP
jgi:hypothetical protein